MVAQVGELVVRLLQFDLELFAMVAFTLQLTIQFSDFFIHAITSCSGVAVSVRVLPIAGNVRVNEQIADQSDHVFVCHHNVVPP